MVVATVVTEYNVMIKMIGVVASNCPKWWQSWLVVVIGG